MISKGEIPREEGMHRVHINQAEHYARKLKEGIWGTRNGISIQTKTIKVGYSVPGNAGNAKVVEKVLMGLGKHCKRIGGRKSVT